jgi:hypothetical protein
MDMRALSRVIPLVVTVSVGACTYDEFDSSADFDAVITVENPEYSYTGNQTYAVVPEVADLTTMVEGTVRIPNKERWQEVILAAIHRNMKEVGYTEETGDIRDADVVVGAGIVTQENWALVGGYYSWWGWYGWYYYPVTYAVSFDSGSVIMVMIDPEWRDESRSAEDTGTDGGVGPEAYQAVWGAGLHGLLDAATESKVDNGIDQAFEQSPYLHVNGGRR